MDGPEPGAPFSCAILAGGAGTRMGPLGETLPKALLPVLDRPLIARQLEALPRDRVGEVVVVTGHRAERIEAALAGPWAPDIPVHCVRQVEPRGIAHALACAEPFLRRPFLLLLGDIYFDAADLEGLLEVFERPGVEAVLAVHREPDVDRIRRSFCVDVQDGRALRVEEKPRQPSSPWRGVGLYGFGPDVFEAVRRTPRSALRNEYELTDAVQIHIASGARTAVFECRHRDFNVSDEDDLLALNLHALERWGHHRFVADGVEDRGAAVSRSVVLGPSELAKGAELRECLVLPGARVPPGRHERRVFGTGVGAGER